MTHEAKACLCPYNGTIPLWEGAEASTFDYAAFDESYLFQRARWTPGPWMQEPDRVEWRAFDLPCLIVRQPHFGHLCGYVAVPPEHPAHGKHYGVVEPHVHVHGGLTFSERCVGLVCHVPKPGEVDDVWWFGFDCNHYNDEAPGMARGSMSNYRGIAYVAGEVIELAAQLAVYKEPAE